MLISQGRDDKVTGKKLNDLLTDKGYLQTTAITEGKSYKIPTDKGKQAGIEPEERIFRGESGIVNLFNTEAQQMVVELYCGIY